jgi:hypothetical protein
VKDEIISYQPFMGISLPYGVGTLNLEDFKVPYFSTYNV